MLPAFVKSLSVWADTVCQVVTPATLWSLCFGSWQGSETLLLALQARILSFGLFCFPVLLHLDIRSVPQSELLYLGAFGVWQIKERE